MNTSLLFLDDTYGKNTTQVAALTGLRVPVEKLENVRLAFAEMLLNRLKLKRDDHITTHLPPLHGSAFLKDRTDVDDELRLQIFKDVVDIVTNSQLSIHRVGIFVSDEAKKLHKDSTERFAYSLAWFQMIDTLESYLRSNYLIPVMDRTDDVFRLWQLSNLVGQGVLIRAQGHGEMYSLKGAERILGEVLFADHRYSFLTQIVDICSYLRHVCDRMRVGLAHSEFQQRLAEVGGMLKPAIAYEGVYPIMYNDKPLGPANVTHIHYSGELLDEGYH